MRFTTAILGVSCVLALSPAHAQTDIGRPDPIEQAEEAAPAAPARKPQPAAPAAATPNARPAATPSARPAAGSTPTATPATAAPTATTSPSAKPQQAAPAQPATSQAAAKPNTGKPEAKPEAKPEKQEAKQDSKQEAKSDPKAGGDLSPADRAAVQAALSWSGDFGPSVEGEDLLTTAIKNFQKRNNAKVTGTLTPEERDRLIAASKSHENEVGWRVVDDPSTGARIGIPTKMMPVKQDTRDGTLWRSRHGDVQVDTFRINNGLVLAALFELEKTQPKTRKVEYSQLRPDSFVISGLQGLRRFAARAWVKNGDIRGFTIQYDQAIEGIVEPVANAMANTYTPFPQGAPVLAPVAARKVEYGTAIAVSAQGHLVTDRRLTDGCQVLIAAGHGPAERVGVSQDFSLLRIYGAHGLVPAVLAENPAAGDVTLSGVPEPQPRDGNSVAKNVSARIAAMQVTPSPGAGYSGGGVFDTSGKLAGLLSVRPTILASAEPLVPQASLLPLDALRDFLRTHNVAAAASAGKPTVMRIICVR